jgi:hypothetical protein
VGAFETESVAAAATEVGGGYSTKRTLQVPSTGVPLKDPLLNTQAKPARGSGTSRSRQNSKIAKGAGSPGRL